MRCLIVLGLLSLGLSSCRQSAAGAVLRVVAIPDQNKDRMRQDQEEIATWLQGVTGAEVSMVFVESYNAAVVALVSGQADLGWLGGVTTVQATQKSGGKVQPIVCRAKDREFKSYLIVRGDSPAQSATDLEGKSLTFGSVDSTSGHVMPRFLMAKELGIDKPESFFSRVAYSGSHDKTISDVRDGAFDAGMVNYQVYDRSVAEGKVTKEQVRVLWESPSYVDYSWSVRSDVDDRFGKGTIGKIKQAFVDLDGSSEQEKTVMRANGNAQKYLAADPTWWDGIRAVIESPEMASVFRN